MTNLEKFIEIMNSTFNAGFSKDNLDTFCSPCSALKQHKFACAHLDCKDCQAWWHREYKIPERRL